MQVFLQGKNQFFLSFSTAGDMPTLLCSFHYVRLLLHFSVIGRGQSVDSFE
jgi:hypothetical protein